MKIHGLQKLTLLDFPGSVACTVFLNGCDFKCPFCHNFELVDGTAKPVMDETEFFDFLKTRKGRLDGVAITGGEPCLRNELPEFMRKIKDAGFGVKLDTNGNNPNILKKIIENNLVDYIAMDIKNSPEKYNQTTGLPYVNLENIDESINLIRHSKIKYEFRTTIVDELHTEYDIMKIAKWIAGSQQYFLQPFENKTTVPCQTFHTPSENKLLSLKNIAQMYIQKVEIRGIR